jgi:hypothetical protein
MMQNQNRFMAMDNFQKSQSWQANARAAVAFMLASLQKNLKRTNPSRKPKVTVPRIQSNIPQHWLPRIIQVRDAFVDGFALSLIYLIANNAAHAEITDVSPGIQKEIPLAVPGSHALDSAFCRDLEGNAKEYNQTDNPSGPSAAVNNDGPALTKLDNVAEYTAGLRDRPRLTFVQQLKPYNGRLHDDNWFKVAIRPFILYCYPAVLWSAIVYSCSVGWLIVLSESVAVTYRSKKTYGFSALSTGLIYISPFVGGVLGTAVAGKVSDIIVRAMSKRNGGLYEPEFRLVMAIPITITTVIGLMGFGWSAEIHDAWIVPTIFFGIISFGCSLGSTTAITFCVDSYRQYAGEALVTLNFSKNIFHGLVFSLFFNRWLDADGSKIVFLWLGIIQLVLMAFSVPMYIFGKRARMWTVRKNLMEKF